MSSASLPRTGSRNQSMELFKIIASVFVVLLHVRLSGKVGDFVSSFAGNFAVPVFFAITGYFNYGADRATLTRRLRHLLRLYLLVIAVTLLYGIINTELQGGSTIVFLRNFIPDVQEWAIWLTLHRDPRNDQLWYLTATCICYLILRIYVTFQAGQEKPVDYRPLYIVAFIMGILYLLLQSSWYIIGVILPYPLLENAYTAGFPMFTLGIFCHQYQDRIQENFHPNFWKLLALILGGQALLWIQNTAGLHCLPFGIYLKTIGMLLMLIYYPTLTTKQGVFYRLIGKFGIWSTYIYVFHIRVFVVYGQFLQEPIRRMLSGSTLTEETLMPWILVLLCFLTAVLFDLGGCLLRRLCRRK